MWKGFLVWILKFALRQLGDDVDLAIKGQIDNYNTRKSALEKYKNETAIELGKLETEIVRLESERLNNMLEIEFLVKEVESQNETLRKIHDEKSKKLADIDNLDDNTLLRSEL